MTEASATTSFLGREFLLWLWYCCETEGGLFELPLLGRVGVAFDSAMELRSPDGRGKVIVRGDSPTRLPEAAVALQTGRWPVTARLIVARGDDTFELTLNGDSFDLQSVKVLSDSVHDGQEPREANEERVRLLMDLPRLVDGLYRAFLKRRTASTFLADELVRMRHWARTRRPAAEEPSAEMARAASTGS